MCSASIAGSLVHWAGNHNTNRATCSAICINPPNFFTPITSFMSYRQTAAYILREE